MGAELHRQLTLFQSASCLRRRLRRKTEPEQAAAGSQTLETNKPANTSSMLCNCVRGSLLSSQPLWPIFDEHVAHDIKITLLKTVA